MEETSLQNNQRRNNQWHHVGLLGDHNLSHWPKVLHKQQHHHSSLHHGGFQTNCFFSTLTKNICHVQKGFGIWGYLYNEPMCPWNEKKTTWSSWICSPRHWKSILRLHGSQLQLLQGNDLKRNPFLWESL